MRFRQKAKQDVLDAAVWYERRRTERGNQFIHDVDLAISRIEESPLPFPIYEPPARRVLLSRFPYAVYYLTSPLVVLRVLHFRRHPHTWKARADD